MYACVIRRWDAHQGSRLPGQPEAEHRRVHAEPALEAGGGPGQQGAASERTIA